jgi:hypothetical protein
MSIAMVFLQMSSLQNDATVDKLSTKRFRQTATGLQTRVNPKNSMGHYLSNPPNLQGLTA